MKKFFVKILLSGFFSLLLAAQADAGRHFCKRYHPKAYTPCETALPLLYSDQFNSFNADYWSSENRRARIHRQEWLGIWFDTVTSADYADQNLDSVRVVLRFRTIKWARPEFKLNFTNGEELVFSYNKVTYKKRKRNVTRRRFSTVAWPEISAEPVVIRFPNKKWNTLAVDYDRSTGLVYIDTDNDCGPDYVLEWEPDLTFSHVSGYNQRWDLFELYASVQEKEAEPEGPGSGLPSFDLAWDGVPVSSNGLGADPSGYVYVSDPATGSVQKFDQNGNPSAEWSGFADPGSLAVDADGNLFVVDGETASIKKLDADGTLLAELENFNGEYGMLGAVLDVATDRSGTLYVPAFNPTLGINRIVTFNSDMLYAGQWFLDTESPVHAIDVDSSGNIYTASDLGIRKYDAYGNFLFTVVAAEPATDGLSTKYTDIFVDESDRLFVLENGENNRVLVFDGDGAPLFTFGSYGSGDGEFLSPKRIAVRSYGIFVLDPGTGRVLKFN